MFCPFCQHRETKVIDSRPLLEENAIKRRRQCEACSQRFTTMEHLGPIAMPMVVKNDGRREEYNANKIKTGLKKACQKRPVSAEDIDLIIDYVEQKIRELKLKELPCASIGQYLMGKLKEVDPVAYVRFVSFYWDYENIDEFVNELISTQSFTTTSRAQKRFNQDNKTLTSIQ